MSINTPKSNKSIHSFYYVTMSKEIPRSNIKTFEFSEIDKQLILKALSFIWVKTNKKVESCWFKRNKAMIFMEEGGCAYFNLDEELSSDKVIVKFCFFFLISDAGDLFFLFFVVRGQYCPFIFSFNFCFG